MKKSKLKIEGLNLTNFATFENQTINFHKAMSSIIGETGSGKSLILEALQLILGHRADKKLVRKETEFAIVEASLKFQGEDISSFLDNLGFPAQGTEIVIKRIIYKNGSSKSYLNYSQCSLSTLQRVSKRFFDLVGQFENQKLLSEKYQLSLLDKYAGLEQYQSEYQKTFLKLSQLQEELSKKKLLREERLEKTDYLNFQLSELATLSPDQTEESELIKKKEELIEFINSRELTDRLNSLINESEHSLITQVNSALSLIDQIPNRDEYREKLHNVKEQIEEVSFHFSSSPDDFQNVEQELTSIMDKLNEYAKCKRKYRCETPGLVELWKELEKQKSQFDTLDLEIEKLEAEVLDLTPKVLKEAQNLSGRRQTAAKGLGSSLTTAARSLNMKGASIELQVLPNNDQLTSTGIDQIHLMAETNPGEGLFPVKKIASGGELSRILLCLRQIISTKDSISVFLFDEIDTGMGGETALKVGQALAKVAKNSQVIAVTHLPQVAKYSDQLIHVNKYTKEKRTFSEAHLFSGAKRSEIIQSMNP